MLYRLVDAVLGAVLCGVFLVLSEALQMPFTMLPTVTTFVFCGVRGVFGVMPAVPRHYICASEVLV